MLFQSRVENRETKIFRRPPVYGFGLYCGGPSLNEPYHLYFHKKKFFKQIVSNIQQVFLIDIYSRVSDLSSFLL